MRKSQARQRQVQAARLGERDLHVLDEVFDKEPRLEVALQHPRRVVGERPRSSCPAANRRERALEVEAGAIGVQQRLADTDHAGPNQDLVDHLGVLPRARRALMHDRLAEEVEQRPQAPDGRRVAADHDRERSVSRSDVTARDGRIDALNSSCARCIFDLARQGRLTRRHIDQYGSGTGSRQGPIRSEHHLPDIGREPDHRENNVCLRSDLRRRSSPNGASREQRLSPLPCPRVNDHRIAGLEKMPAHRRAHHSRADPAEPCRLGRNRGGFLRHS